MKKIEFETFRKINDYNIKNLTQEAPDCFNGVVSVKKYKITVEEVKEPVEVIQERIQKLYDENKNYHNSLPIQAVAKEYNYEIRKK